MAGNGLDVKEIDEIKRLLNLGFTNRQIARSINVHRNTINKYVERINEKKSCENFVEPPPAQPSLGWTSQVDWENVRSEFLKGVPLNILHEELVESGKVSVLYNGFCNRTLEIVRRQHLRAAAEVLEHIHMRL